MAHSISGSWLARLGPRIRRALEVEFQITIGNECRTLISWVGSSIGGHLKEVRVLVRAEPDRDIKRLDQEVQMASFAGQVVDRRPKPLCPERVLKCRHNGSQV